MSEQTVQPFTQAKANVFAIFGPTVFATYRHVIMVINVLFCVVSALLYINACVGYSEDGSVLASSVYPPDDVKLYFGLRGYYYISAYLKTVTVYTSYSSAECG